MGEEAGIINEAVLERLVFDPGGGVDVVDVEVKNFGAEAGNDAEGGVLVGGDGGGFGAIFGGDSGDEFNETALMADVDGGTNLGVVDGLNRADEGVDGGGKAGFDGESEAELMGAVGPAADEVDVLVLAWWKWFIS